MNLKNAIGETATVYFTIPPLHEVFKQAGMELPELLGKEIPEMPAAAETADTS